jgi:hypothetical protein
MTDHSPCNCEQALDLTRTLSSIAENPLQDEGTRRVASSVLRRWPGGQQELDGRKRMTMALTMSLIRQQVVELLNSIDRELRELKGEE